MPTEVDRNGGACAPAAPVAHDVVRLGGGPVHEVDAAAVLPEKAALLCAILKADPASVCAAAFFELQKTQRERLHLQPPLEACSETVLPEESATIAPHAALACCCSSQLWMLASAA